MKKSQTLLTCTLAASLLACGSAANSEDPKAPNEKNFKAALSQYFEKKGQLCLDVELPQDVFESSIGNVEEKMAALVTVGIVQSTETEKSDADSLGKPTKPQKPKHYTLTEAAKPFASEIKPTGIVFEDHKPTSTLCWGKKVPDKIVKWDGPVALGNYQEAKVTYTYKIEVLAEWAKNPDVQKAFPKIKTALDGSSKNEDHHALKLTNQGWEALGLDSKW